MIKEYPKEQRVEYVVPQCPRCGKLMKILDINLESTFNITSLVSKCKCHSDIYRPGDEDVAVISTYSATQISFVDDRGNKI